MAPCYKLLEASPSVHCQIPGYSSSREITDSQVLQIEDSKDPKRQCLSPHFCMELRDVPNGTPTLDDVLSAVRQLQENDIRKSEEIQWLRQRLDSLSKDIARRSPWDIHSGDLEEMRTHVVSPLVGDTNMQSRDQLSCSNWKAAYVPTVKVFRLF